MMTHSDFIQPVFIGGCDRSGTTLLGATAARFASVVTLPESQFIFETARMHIEENSSMTSIADYISDHFRYSAWRKVGCTPPQALLKKGDNFRSFLNALIVDYARATGVMKPKVFVDHSPDNSFNLDALQRVFPELKFAHMIRDGRGVAASLMPLDWGPNDILEMAKYWRNHIAAGEAGARRVRKGYAVTLHFEKILTGEFQSLQAIAELVGASSFNQASALTTYVSPAYARNTHALIGAAPDPGRVDAWRKKLKPREVELFEYLAGEALDRLGYERVQEKADLQPPTPLEKAVTRLRRWIVYRINHTKHVARRTA